MSEEETFPMTKTEVNKIQGDSYRTGLSAGRRGFRADLEALMLKVLGTNLEVNKSSKQVIVGDMAYREAFFEVYALLEKEPK